MQKPKAKSQSVLTLSEPLANLKQSLSQLPWLSELKLAIGFILFLTIFEAIFFQIGFLAYLNTLPEWQLTSLLLTSGGYLSALLVMTGIVWASFISRPKLRIIYFILLTIPLFMQYSFWNANQTFMALHDFELITGVGPAMPWSIAALTAYLNPLALIPLIVYGWLLIKGPSGYSRRDTRLFLIILYGVLLINISRFGYQKLTTKQANLTSSANINALSWDGFAQSITEAVLHRITLRYVSTVYGTRETLALITDQKPHNNIVLIIDESIRGDHLSVNGYERPTTPYLEQLTTQGLVYNWGIAAAASTCSQDSVLALMTGVYRFPDIEYRAKLNPTIFQYAKAMNYQTTLFDAEASERRIHIKDDLPHIIDQFTGVGQFGLNYDNDTRLATTLAQLLHQSEGNFVIALKNGVHYPYNTRYPAEATEWTPTLGGQYAILGDREELVNSYDNAIRYNSDNFFKTLLADQQILDKTTIIYTSDHGQTLSEHGERYTHCKDTKNEAMVPLMLITNQSLPIDEQYRASHHNIFATLLDLINFPATKRQYDYRPSLLTVTATDSEPRYYLYGSFHGTGKFGVINFD